MTSLTDATHDPALRSWVPAANIDGCDFPIQNLPFGRFRPQSRPGPWRIGVAIGDQVLDLHAAAAVWPADVQPLFAPLAAGDLNAFMALGRSAWRRVRAALSAGLAAGSALHEPLARCLVERADAELALPCRIGDYTDFYAGIHHARAIGSLLRPDNPLLPNYKWVPIGYHGRASSVVPSGTPIRRPNGQRKRAEEAAPSYGPSRNLDYELELGVWIGPGNALGEPVPVGGAAGHIAGYCLLNDWSARDVQAWEYQPLGPFLAKSFGSTVSPWVVTPEALAPFLQRIVTFWGARADESGLALRLRIGADVPKAVMVDGLRLRQMLFNLIGNALKFTEQGSVELSAALAPSSDGDMRLRFSVSDTGPGIAPEHLPALFDRFSQVDDGEVRRFGGTGLGLAIVRQLAELMGGVVSVESRLGAGSVFHVDLPLEAVQPAEVRDDRKAEAAQGVGYDGLRILAIDDNTVNLLVLDQLLTSLGQTVTKAAGGAEALAVLAAESFDLVLSDIQMPEMTGVEVLQRLRAAPGPNQFVPVVALTADVTSGGRQRYLDLGFREHAAKPIQLPELLGAIGRAMAEPETAAARVA